MGHIVFSREVACASFLGGGLDAGCSVSGPSSCASWRCDGNGEHCVARSFAWCSAFVVASVRRSDSSAERESIGLCECDEDGACCFCVFGFGRALVGIRFS